MLDSLAITPSIGDRRNPAARHTLLQRVSAEFQEMPCMRLTAGQAGGCSACNRTCVSGFSQLSFGRGRSPATGERYRFNDARTWPSSHAAEAHAGVVLRAY